MELTKRVFTSFHGFFFFLPFQVKELEVDERPSVRSNDLVGGMIGECLVDRAIDCLARSAEWLANWWWHPMGSNGIPYDAYNSTGEQRVLEMLARRLQSALWEPHGYGWKWKGDGTRRFSFYLESNAIHGRPAWKPALAARMPQSFRPSRLWPYWIVWRWAEDDQTEDRAGFCNGAGACASARASRASGTGTG